MENSFDELKKKLIIDENDYNQEKLKPIMEILLDFVRITQSGEIIIIKNVPSRKILPLILCVRFITNKLDNKIKESITKEELKKYAGLKEDVFNARLSELTREGIGEKISEGYKVRNIFLVEGFLSDLKDNKSIFRESIKKSKNTNIDQKIIEEPFNLNSDIKLKDYLKEKNISNFRETILLIGNYIVKNIYKSENAEFSESQILFAFNQLGLRKPKAFHQIFLDTKQEKNWIIEGKELFKWRITEKGFDDIKKKEKIRDEP